MSSAGAFSLDQVAQLLKTLENFFFVQMGSTS